ncbi:MAG TPA: RiPP maturation radical SAM C-methyltransferase [Mycobacteriales bacterium]|nr:RiPP maturation radical SAM C-methyltransferase [Mycobacteriales bacterium]
MRVLLVNMPWAPIDTPSLALGILRNAVTRARPDDRVDVVNANLDFVDWITERYRFNLFDYRYYSNATYFAGTGDWIFSSALYDDPDWRWAEFTAGAARPMTDEETAMNRDLHRMVPGFVHELVERLIASRPDVVGFGSTYQQNTAALAAARTLKRFAPDIVTVFGGANCDGAQGAALHRNFPFVDYVVRGEGETAFPRLLSALDGGQNLSSVPGLCWRSPDGPSTANPMDTQPLPPGQIVPPDYTGYFEQLEASAAAEWVEPVLVVEGARGCWWGEKHHCTFCGLNGSTMQFRGKRPDRFFEEITALVGRHQILDMIVVDNILDMGYLTSLLPALVEAGFDLRLQYEIKSNLRRHQLELLANAGLVHVQPGVESLSSRVLALMDKGVTGCQNVRVLRDTQAVGLSTSWNYLYGFPGESDEDYLDILAQLPALHHLEPCGACTRIAIERFSPFFDRPELGFANLRPHRQYGLIYDLPDAELFDLAYLFETDYQGIGTAVADQLDAAVSEWQAEYLHSELTHLDLGAQIVLFSRRTHFDWSVRRLDDPVEVAAFRLLDQPRSRPVLTRMLNQALPVELRPVPETRVRALLDEWRDLGLVFTDAGQYIHVAPPTTNQEVMRVDSQLVSGILPAEPDPVPSPL